MRGIGPVALITISLLFIACTRQDAYGLPQDEWQAAYDALSPEEQEAVRAGRLVFTTGTFHPAPVLLPYPSKTVLSPQYVESFACPEVPLDESEWTSSTDLGTFFGSAIANKPGQRFNAVLFQFILPAPEDVDFYLPDDHEAQGAYLMAPIWSADPHHYPVDAGLTYQRVGGTFDWFPFSYDAVNGWQAEGQWRLRNKYSGTDEPLTGALVLRVADDGQLELVIEATGDTEWLNVDTNARDTQRTIQVPNILGVPGDGDDATFTIQINYGSQKFPPTANNRIPDIVIYDMKVAMWNPVNGTYNNATPWDFTDPNQSEFLIICPSDGIEEAYEVDGGSPTAEDPENGFNISIDTATSNVHQPCVNVRPTGDYHVLNFAYHMPSIAGSSRTFFDLRNCGRAPRTIDFTIDDSWASLSPPTVTVNAGPPERVSIVRAHNPSGVDTWFNCGQFGQVMQTTTVRALNSDTEIHSFPFTIDCTVPNSHQMSSVLIRWAEGAWRPPTGTQGRFYNTYYTSSTQSWCDRSITPNLRKVRNYATWTTTVEYGVYDITSATYLPGYTSTYTVNIDDEDEWTDDDFIDETLQTVLWWNEAVVLCWNDELD
ncbi:MAG: hypothetical protein ROY82_08060 [Truepera sp.]|jgi:hypothetical protein|nr:hypothetical protein [Truepera sp.]